jgi:hypothetical protein
MPVVIYDYDYNSNDNKSDLHFPAMPKDSIQWVAKALSPGVKLNSHPNFPSRLRMSGAIPPFLHRPSRHARGLLYHR